MQNVKAIYFPFNIYSRIVNPDVLQSDTDYLKQHSGAQLWIQGYADIRGDIFSTTWCCLTGGRSL